MNKNLSRELPGSRYIVAVDTKTGKKKPIRKMPKEQYFRLKKRMEDANGS